MPYSPGIQYRGDAWIAQGNIAAMQALGGTISDVITEHKNRAKQAAAMQSMLETLPEDTLREIGVDPKGIDKLSVEQARGKLEGLAVRNKLAEFGEAMQRERSKEQRAQQLFESVMAQQQATKAAQGDLSRMMAAENVPAPFNNEMFGRMALPPGQTSPGLQQLLQANARHGATLDPETLARALEGQQRKGPRGLPLGAKVPVGDLGHLIGTGEEWEPNFIPTPKPDKEPAVEVPTYPWLFADDKEVFTQGITALPPKERDAALKARSAYKNALGTDDPLREALAALIGGKTGTKPAETTAKPTAKKYFNPETGKLQDKRYAPGR